MRYTLVFIFSIMILPLFAQEQLDVMSFNIRYNSPNDGINIWENRKDKVAAIINFHEVDVFGLQEATKAQLDDLEPLSPTYKWIGVGRDDGIAKGEFSPIFYNPTKLTLMSKGTFWLSEDTDKPNKGWDAALPRIATYAVLKLNSGREVFVVNTHYDHKGVLARENSSTLIVQKIKALNTKSLPVILMGDFNATPTEKPVTNYIQAGYLHSRISKPKVHMGPVGTFNGFNEKEVLNHEIDHIFIKGKIQILKTATLSPTWGGLFASDHHAVLAQLTIQ